MRLAARRLERHRPRTGFAVVSRVVEDERGEDIVGSFILIDHMRMRPLAVLLSLCGVLSTHLVAWQRTSQNQAVYKLQKARFVGSHYSQEDLLKASGLKIGGDISPEGFQNAATILSQSGIFSQVKYSFNGAEAEYDLTDNPNLVTCRFENLVWISDQELLSELSRRVPLFTGALPLTGDLATNVGRAIEAILKERGITATISSMPAANLNGPVNAIVFSAVTPKVEIADIQFSGASPAQIPSLQKAVAPLLGTDYGQSMLEDFCTNTLRPIYMNQGYLHVEFPRASATPISTSAELAKVKITVPIQEGSVYQVKALNWPGTDLLPAAAAPKLYLLKPGDVANQELLKKSLNNLGGAYLKHGYMKATVRATPSFDETEHAVAYDIEIVPGDAYRLRNVEFKNLSEAQLKQVNEVWKLKPGDTYDPTYAPAFLVNNRQSLHSLDGWAALWTQKVDDDHKVVDLILTFRPGGTVH
jgi:outer membrane protein assembly factor BamA